MLNHPDTFEKIEQDNIILFHGTGSSALPSILKHGMNSVDKAKEDGIELTTGEEWSRIGGKRNFISFTDDLETAIRYANIGAITEQKGNAEFGVMIGLSTEALQHLRKCGISSDTPEIGIKDYVSTEHIKMLAVPPHKVEFVKRLVGDMPIEVMPMNIEDPFYGMTRFEMKKELELDKSEKTSDINRQWEYGQDDVKKLAKGRKLSRVLGWITNLKEKTMNRGKQDECR